MLLQSKNPDFIKAWELICDVSRKGDFARFRNMSQQLNSVVFLTFMSESILSFS